MGGVTTCISELYETKRWSGALNLNSTGLTMLLDWGMTIDGYTIANDVFVLHPGNYLIYEDGCLKEKNFYSIRTDKVVLSSEDDYVEMLDEAYREAIRRQFSKDDEYGYKIIATLSGGMDSRMTVWVSHELGWSKQLNVTFSNSGWYDETTARKVSLDLRHEWLFKRLEDANFLADIDRSIEKNGGNRTYIGEAHSSSLMHLIDFDGAGYGILHTGSQGGQIRGYTTSDGSVNKGGNIYLEYLRSHEILPRMDYSNVEAATIINRDGFIYEVNSMSPLWELDFFEKTLQVPTQIINDGKIYIKWVRTKYPEMNKYVWATTGAPYGSKSFNPFIKPCGCYFRQLPKYIRYKLGKGGFAMNPWRYFVQMNKGLLPLFNTYSEYCDAVTDDTLRKQISSFLVSEDVSKKFKAVSVLSAIKQFFI